MQMMISAVDTSRPICFKCLALICSYVSVTCPKNISNGALIACNVKIGSSCDFRCNPNYSKTVEKVICLASRNWHTNPCQGRINNDDESLDTDYFVCSSI